MDDAPIPTEDAELQLSAVDNICEWFAQLPETEGIFESPIDIDLTKTKTVTASPLRWLNFEVPPKKMKITNTGHTVIFSAKWGQERPYLTGGLLRGKYVFSQLHLHWGINDMEGSEHSVDGCFHPGEVHVVFFKSCYLTQEAALKEKDGIVVVVYFFKLQEGENAGYQSIVQGMPSITKAHTSLKLPPTAITSLMRPFDSDYFAYWGTVSTTTCTHYIMWLISRVPTGISTEQIDSLRFLNDAEDNLIKRNYRPIQSTTNRVVLHVCPSAAQYSTLLPIPKEDSLQLADRNYQVYFSRPVYNNHRLNSPNLVVDTPFKKKYHLEKTVGTDSRYKKCKHCSLNKARDFCSLLY